MEELRITPSSFGELFSSTCIHSSQRVHGSYRLLLGTALAQCIVSRGYAPSQNSPLSPLVVGQCLLASAGELWTMASPILNTGRDDLQDICWVWLSCR